MSVRAEQKTAVSPGLKSGSMFGSGATKKITRTFWCEIEQRKKQAADPALPKMFGIPSGQGRSGGGGGWGGV